MQLVVIALLPAALMGIYNHGLKALAVLVVSTGSAALAEWLYDHLCTKEHCEGFQCSGNRTSYRPEYAGRNSALDPGARQYFAIIVVKQLFGGLGQNFMNPALAARCFLMISFAGKMTDFLYQTALKVQLTV